MLQNQFSKSSVFRHHKYLSNSLSAVLRKCALEHQSTKAKVVDAWTPLWRFLRFFPRFWNVFNAKNFKKDPILKRLWLFGAQKFMLFYALMIHDHEIMMFSYWIPKVRFWIAQNYSRISILLWPNRNQNPAFLSKMTEPCEHTTSLW